MKRKNDIFRRATADDGKQMLDIIESYSSGGNLDIMYTRRGDAYRSYFYDCKDAEITLCTGEDNKIKAQMTCLPRRLYVNGELRTAGYITGLCKREGSLVNLQRLFDTALELTGCELLIFSVLGGDDGILKMIEKRRKYMPDLHVISKYTTFLLSPKAIKKTKHGFTFRQATEDDFEKLDQYYREYGKRHNFFPEITLRSGPHGLGIKNFYLLIKQNGDIAAAGALWNQRDYKQNIIKKYGGIYKALSKLNILLRLLRYPPLPKVNTVADFAYISFFAAHNNEPINIKAFLGEITATAHRLYSMVCIGATESSETNCILRKIRSVNFNSDLCLVDFKKDDTWIEMCKHPAFFECGLL